MAKRRLLLLALALIGAASAAAQTPYTDGTTPSLRAPPQTVPIANFSTGPARCDVTARTARVALNVTLRPADSQISGANATVDILIDGVSVGARTAAIRRDPSVTGVGAASILVSRDLALPFPNGTKRVQVVLNRAYHTAEQSFTYNCYQVRGQATAPAPTLGLQLPDLAVGPMVIFYYDPPLPDFDPCHGAGRTPFGDCRLATSSTYRWWELPGNAYVQRDLNTVVPFWRATGSACPTERDMQVTLTIAAPFVANSLVQRRENWQLPEGAVEEGFFYFEFQSDVRQFRPGVAYIDARETTRAPSPGNQSFPVGYEWVLFHRTLPCTNDGVFEFRLDPHNRMREQDENNNVLRFRYRTTPP